MENCELILVGGGTSGCMLAYQLTRRFGLRVTLVETPAESARLIDRERPSHWRNLIGSCEDFQLGTDAGSGLAGRRLRWPRGRGLGGSSRINAMIWFPPTADDLRMIAAAGGNGWSEGTLRQAVQQVEQLVGPESPRWQSEACRRFLQAADGVPGAVPQLYRRFNREARRWSADSLLAEIPASSLSIVRGTVERLIWNGNRAAGIEVWDGAERRRLGSRHGVVLTAGTIGSPTILMRSGIGPAESLRSAGVDVHTESAGVGSNLQDHLIMPVIFRVPAQDRFSAVPTPAELARWQVAGAGPVGSNLAECGGLFDDGRLQFHVTPTHYLTFPPAGSSSRTGSCSQTGPASPDDAAAAITLGVSVTAPKSRGRLLITSRSSREPATVEPNYLHVASDLDLTVEGIELARKLAARAPLRGWLQEELVPGAKRRDPRSLARAVARYAQTLYHPVGTCAWEGQGGKRSAAVIDPQLRVIGVQGAWVVDASILPRLTTGNPSVTLLAIAIVAAERIADQLGYVASRLGHAAGQQSK